MFDICATRSPDGGLSSLGNGTEMMASPEDSRIDPKEIARRMKFDYSRGVKDQPTRILEGISDLCRKLENQDCTLNSFMHEVADLISKQLGIASVAIAIKDRYDGKYRYPIVTGVEESIVEGFKNIAYTKEQLFDDSTFASHEISRQTRIYLAEEHPYANGEEFSYRRPQLIGMKRRSLNDSLEADYIDIFIFGPNNEVLGWIETSGTRLMKLPDIQTIRWMELLANLLGFAIRTLQ